MIIQAKDLTKVYRRFEKEPGLLGSLKSLVNRKFVDKAAVSAFDLEIGGGEFVGLIGPNGAGKTTLIKMLTGIIRKSSGALSVLGHDPNRLENELKRQYAVVMGQKSQLFFELSAADTFILFQELYGLPDAEYRANLRYFTHLFGVSDSLNVQVRTLSLGERMKMELIAALLHNPRVLFLDEPTIGLDAIAQKQIRKFLRQVNEERGTTILLTSHYMEDISSLCKRCVVINKGVKIYDGDTRALFDRYHTHKKVTAVFENENGAWLPGSADVLEQGPYRLSFMVKKEDVGPALREMMNRYEISDLSVEDEDIGSVVERIYGQSGEAVG